jgi:hypothetical protein
MFSWKWKLRGSSECRDENQRSVVEREMRRTEVPNIERRWYLRLGGSEAEIL